MRDMKGKEFNLYKPVHRFVVLESERGWPVGSIITLVLTSPLTHSQIVITPKPYLGKTEHKHSALQNSRVLDRCALEELSGANIEERIKEIL